MPPEHTLADDYMPSDIDYETRQFISAVCICRDLEQRLPLINSISEIEDLRAAATLVAQSPLAKELNSWGIRVGMMCQRRVAQLISAKLPENKPGYVKKYRAPRPSGEIPPKPVTEEASNGERERLKPLKEEAKKSHLKRHAPSDKFRSYWVKEKRLLEVTFDIWELEKIGEYWWKYFSLWRAEQEQILADSRQEAARRKAVAALTKPESGAQPS